MMVHANYTQKISYPFQKYLSSTVFCTSRDLREKVTTIARHGSGYVFFAAASKIAYPGLYGDVNLS